MDQPKTWSTNSKVFIDAGRTSGIVYFVTTFSAQKMLDKAPATSFRVRWYNVTTEREDRQISGQVLKIRLAMFGRKHSGMNT